MIAVDMVALPTKEASLIHKKRERLNMTRSESIPRALPFVVLRRWGLLSLATVAGYQGDIGNAGGGVALLSVRRRGGTAR